MYVMEVYCDGGCRGNGNPGAIGAAAAVFKSKSGAIISSHGACLPDDSDPYEPRPTNQRAEITAIIFALQTVLDKYKLLRTTPYLDVKIYSDSQYAVSCMEEWIYKWRVNGWISAAGRPVVNQDLIKQADDLDTDVKEIGRVEYCWIPRRENQEADECANEMMDEHDQGLHFYGCDSLKHLKVYDST